MKSNFKLVLGLAATLTAPTLASAALTVTVDGSGGGATTFAKLSEAINYVNTNSSEPNVINVTANHTDDTQIEILVPVTINGVEGAPPEISVDRDAITAASDIGEADRAYIEIKAAGDVVLNDLRIFCIGANYSGSTIINALQLHKPEGTGNYTLNSVEIGGSSNGAYVVPTVADPYYSAAARFWYGLGGTRGAIGVLNTGGSGSYNATFNDCHLSMARGQLLYISNQSGTTTVNGGIIAAAGEDTIRVDGATGVTFTGAEDNRIRLSQAMSSNFGMKLRVLNSAVIDEMAYMDFVSNANRGNLDEDPPYGNAILVISGTITDMHHIRVGNVHSHGLHVVDGTVNVSDSTFHANGIPNFNSSSLGTPDPIRIDGGTVTITDSIFTSDKTGQVQINGGTVTLTNNAVPTDAVAAESLNATTPVTGSPAANTIAVAVSPTYVTTSYDLTNSTNNDFLRPSDPAYATAHTGGTFLYGGAGAPASAVADWQVY